MHHLLYLAIFLLCMSSASAQESHAPDIQTVDFEEQTQLSQKFRMAGYLLNQSSLTQRIETSGSRDASYLLTKARSNFAFAIDKASQKNWLESNAIIDSVLRDLTTTSQLLNKKSFSQNIYIENLKRVEGFILPAWSDLSPEEQQQLETTNKQIEDLLSQAKQSASTGDYDHGTTLLYQTYTLKTQLLQQLKHQDTVVYDLLFNSPEEEYSYMLKRSRHYQGLIDKVLQEKTFTEQTLNLVYIYINKSEKGVTDALSMEKEHQYESAIQLLEQSVADQSTALSIMGIRI